MKNNRSNTENVPSNSDSLSINKAITDYISHSNSDAWLREFTKINQCPQRTDSLENQLNDLIQIAEKFGLYYASNFLKNINH